MKSLISLLIFLSGSFSFAGTPIFEKQRITFNIYKHVIQVVNDKYDYKRTKICSGSMVVDVPDFRNNPDPWIFDYHKICTVNIDGLELNLSLGAYSLVNTRMEDNTDLKIYLLHLTHWSPSGISKIPGLDSVNAASRDLNLKSIILESRAPQGISCPHGTNDDPKKCTIVNPLTISATAEFESL